MPLARLGRNAARHFMRRGPLLPYPESGITVFIPGEAVGEALPNAH